MTVEDIDRVASEATRAQVSRSTKFGRAMALAAAALAVAALGAPGGAARADSAAAAGDAGGQLDGRCGSSGRCDWVGTWATALVPASLFDTNRSMSGFHDESIRMIVQVSIGGPQIRIRLSNAYGANDMVIGHATVGRPAVASTPDLDPGSVRELAFHGKRAVVIPPGEEVVSDPIALAVAPLSQLAVTVHLPEATGPMTWHWIAMQTAYIYAGDHAADPSGAGAASTLNSFYLVAGVEVPRDRKPDHAVVVLGHSIADGFRTTTNANRRWPDRLAQRLITERHGGPRIGVLNLAIAGNAISHDGDDIGLPEIGAAAVDRLDTDVFPQPGVRTLIVDLGVNDLFQHDDPPEPMIAGLRQIARAAHRRGLRVLLATITPATGDPSWTAVREATRQAVNAYIRCNHDADGFVDTDLALRDPANPAMLAAAFDSGDHVHLSDQGAAALAAAIPLSEL